MNYHFLTNKKEFPLLLEKSKYCPKELYIKGQWPLKSTNNKAPIGIAMVGTRRPSNSAEELCRKLIFSLKGTNAIVISGLAQGIDSLCHEAAINANIPTIAVLAQGLETKIEGSRGILAKKILDAGGALVSQFKPLEPAFKGNFIARNKIISGMSLTTVVLQSKTKGGALTTADFALKEQKKVYAIPGDFDNELASGTNMLLDKGLANPVFIPENLYQILGLPKKEGVSIKELKNNGCNLSESAFLFFSKVNGFRKTFPEILLEFHFKANELLAILTELEIAGLVHTEDNFQFYFNGVL